MGIESHPETDSKRGGAWEMEGPYLSEKSVLISFLCMCLGDSVDVAVPIVASVAGVLCLVIVPIIIWRFLTRPPPNNERQHLLDQDNIENHFSGGSEASELTLERGSASSTNPSSTSASSCSDMTETQKNSFNNKITRSAEGRC